MSQTYSISKIAGERVCIFAARQFRIPTTIARLCVPYGNNGGWPYFHLMMMKNGAPIEVHPERPNYYNLIHTDDYIEKIPRLLAAASPDVTLTNFAGSPRVSIEEWCGYLSELTGLEPRFVDNPRAFGSLCTDLTRMNALVGETKVDWRDGIRGMVESLAPELLGRAAAGRSSEAAAISGTESARNSLPRNPYVTGLRPAAMWAQSHTGAGGARTRRPRSSKRRTPPDPTVWRGERSGWRRIAFTRA